jgi:hypothetical protein
MEAMLTVPAVYVADLRSGLFGEWGFAAESLASLALMFGGRGPEEAYERQLRAFDAVRTLLNAIGWRVQPIEIDAEIDLGLHPAVVLRALQNEQEALVDRLQEVTGTPIPEDTHQAMLAHAEGLKEFRASVETLAEQLIGKQAIEDAAAAWRLLPKRDSFLG